MPAMPMTSPAFTSSERDSSLSKPVPVRIDSSASLSLAEKHVVAIPGLDDLPEHHLDELLGRHR